MTQGERVKEIRKSLGLTMERFGERIGVSKASISNIENGNRNLTEQMTRSICREFGVEYLFLTEGIGDMFAKSDSDYISLIDRRMASENEFARNIFKTFAKFTDQDWDNLERMIDIYSGVKNENNTKE